MDDDLAMRFAVLPTALQVEFPLNRWEPDVDADRDEPSPSSVGLATSSANIGCDMKGFPGAPIECR